MTLEKWREELRHQMSFMASTEDFDAERFKETVEQMFDEVRQMLPVEKEATVIGEDEYKSALVELKRARGVVAAYERENRVQEQERLRQEKKEQMRKLRKPFEAFCWELADRLGLDVYVKCTAWCMSWEFLYENVRVLVTLDVHDPADWERKGDSPILKVDFDWLEEDRIKVASPVDVDRLAAVLKGVFAIRSAAYATYNEHDLGVAMSVERFYECMMIDVE